METTIPNNRELNKLFTKMQKYYKRLRFYQLLMLDSGVAEEYIYKFENLVRSKEQMDRCVNREFYFFLIKHKEVFYPIMKHLGLIDYFLMQEGEKDFYSSATIREIACREAGFFGGYLTIADQLRPIKKNIDKVLQTNQADLEVYGRKKKVPHPKTRREERCYRNGFINGLLQICQDARVRPTRMSRKFLHYYTWSHSWLFKIGTPPGETESERLPEALTEILGKR